MVEFRFHPDNLGRVKTHPSQMTNYFVSQNVLILQSGRWNWNSTQNNFGRVKTHPSQMTNSFVIHSMLVLQSGGWNSDSTQNNLGRVGTHPSQMTNYFVSQNVLGVQAGGWNSDSTQILLGELELTHPSWNSPIPIIITIYSNRINLPSFYFYANPYSKGLYRFKECFQELVRP